MRLKVTLVARVHAEYPENVEGPVLWAAAEAMVGGGAEPLLVRRIVHEARGPLATRQEALLAAIEWRDFLAGSPAAFAAHVLDLEAL